MPAPPVDSFHRRIDYLRISITDRCNLRCTYCMPPEGVPHLPHDHILRYEEIVRLIRIASNMGLSKVRITGGEPFVRRDAVYLCGEIARLPQVHDVSVTTNGVRLADEAYKLYEVGVKRINVSLDTLHPDRFASITRRNLFQQVWDGILEAHRVGFHPVKINVVAMRGINDDEIPELAALTFTYPFHVRFIEFMPFGQGRHGDRYLSSDEILAKLSVLGPLKPVRTRNGNGPARHFQLPRARGKIGIISPVSHHFCPTCNRVRITADGKVRTCLFATEEWDILGPLRAGIPDEAIERRLRQAIAAKPEKHRLDEALVRRCNSRPMSTIGG